MRARDGAETGAPRPRREAPDCAPPSARPCGFLVTQRARGEGAGVRLVPDGLRPAFLLLALSAAGGPPGVGGARAGPPVAGPRDCAAPLGSGAQGLGAGPTCDKKAAGWCGDGGGHDLSGPADFWRVCVPFRKRLLLRRPRRGGCLQELSSGTGKTEIPGSCCCWS